MNNDKTCCFYISTFHLFTIILPYIDEKIKEGENIEVLAQNDISSELKTYINNIKSLNIDRDKIMKLEWDGKGEIVDKKKIYIIVGSKNFISNYENIISENETNSEIISCYKLKNNLEISEVLLNHQYLYTTNGKKVISKFSQNEQERKTIKSQ